MNIAVEIIWAKYRRGERHIYVSPRIFRLYRDTLTPTLMFKNTMMEFDQTPSLKFKDATVYSL